MTTRKVETVSHLELTDHGPELASLADLKVQVDSKILPCHSSVLAIHSRALRSMISSTPKESWADGVAVALKGSTSADTRLFLAVCHSFGDVSLTAEIDGSDAWDLEDLFMLAHRLDASAVLKACEHFLVQTPKVIPDRYRLHWLGVAGATGMEKLRKECAKNVLEKILTAPTVVAGLSHIEGLPAEDWAALSTSELKLLLEGRLQAQSELQKQMDSAFGCFPGYRNSNGDLSAKQLNRMAIAACIDKAAA